MASIPQAGPPSRFEDHLPPTPGRGKRDRKITAVLVLLGTALTAFFPLYITKFHAAIDNGGLLLIACVFAADGLLRCLNPENRRTNWSLAFGLGAAAILSQSTAEYSPIVSHLLSEDYAFKSFIQTGDLYRLNNIRAESQEKKGRKDTEDTVPNDSLALLLASLLADVGAIFVIEE